MKLRGIARAERSLADFGPQMLAASSLTPGNARGKRSADTARASDGCVITVSNTAQDSHPSFGQLQPSLGASPSAKCLAESTSIGMGASTKAGGQGV